MKNPEGLPSPCLTPALAKILQKVKQRMIAAFNFPLKNLFLPCEIEYKIVKR